MGRTSRGKTNAFLVIQVVETVDPEKVIPLSQVFDHFVVP